MTQPVNAPLQFAYVVRNLDEAVARWTRATGAGPFFLTDHRMMQDPIYRGGPSQGEYRSAMGYCGNIQIELVEATSDAPSIYNEVLDTQGEVFHHFMPVIDDFDTALQSYQDLGCEVAFSATVPGVGRVAFLDGRAVLGSFIELLENSETTRMIQGYMHQCAADWDGQDLLRSFPAM